MKKIILSFFLYVPHIVFSDNNTSEKYIATIDLTNVVNDRVKVTVDLPKLQNEEIVYCLPKIVPGTYSIYDFGRFVSGFTAIDVQGNTMSFQPLDANQFKIKNATQLDKVEYWVDDSFDSEMSNPVFEPGGTNIEANKNFQINTFGFIGYVEGMKENDFVLQIHKPGNFYGATALKPEKKNQQTDYYHLNNYDHLADSPLLYAVADTAVKEVGGAEVLIGVYAPNKVITAKQIMQEVSEILDAQETYLGGNLPVDKYAFLFYFTDTAGVSGGMGALEHKNSSVYYLPESPIAEIAPFLRDVCAHEFFHIVTPLNIHSTEIADFNFIEPHMSKHLWLYEGQTEYAAHHAQVKAGLISDEEFLLRMQEKIETSSSHYNDTLPFTQMSLGCLDTYKNEYGNVYEKGALINMCLDIELRRLSNGKYGTQQLMADLGKMYGKDKAFQDDELFSVITKLTYPEIGGFFSKYVEGDKAIPYGEFFAAAGIQLSPVTYSEKISLGNISFDFNITAEESIIIIRDMSNANSFARDMGYKTGDRLLRIGKFDLTSGNGNEAIDVWKMQTQPGDKVKMIVERKMPNGKTKHKKLKARAISVPVQDPQHFTINLEATAEQVAVRKAWLGH